MKNERVLAKPSKNAVYSWIGLSIVAILGMLIGDIFSTGLSGTIFYKTLGKLIYPIYYGSWVCLILFMFELLKFGKYIYSSDNSIILWKNREIPYREISTVTIERNAIFLKELVITSRAGGKLAAKAYLLDGEIEQIVTAIKNLASEHSKNDI